MEITHKKFEIFSGTGGVGKTTLATSRAIHLAQNKKKVLLITIDPAKRLKELLGMTDEQAGDVVSIKDPLQTGNDISLDALLMNPQRTIDKIAYADDAPELKSNRIMKVLSKPYGGLNEILSIVELQLQDNKHLYDVIVLDTPPGSHFLDFLDSVDKIKSFFDDSFIDIFNFIKKKELDPKTSKKKRFVTMVVSSGIKKLLGYLQKVTGGKFIEEFIDAVGAIYKSKKTFTSALNIQEQLKSPDYANWFLVTSVEQNKIKEAMELRSHSQDLMGDEAFVLLNKCLGDKIVDWEPTAKTPVQEKLKTSFVTREEELKKFLRIHFNSVLEFSEVFKSTPLDHIKDLTTYWDKYSEETI